MSATPRKLSVTGPSGPYNVFYKEWGAADSPRTMMAVHGFTRNSGDFDFFAARMADVYRIACPDMPGRGQSDWLPMAEYNYPTYVTVGSMLLAQLGVSTVDWVGTSMGGFMGMLLAAQPKTPIRRLVLNDVGPVVTRDTMRALAKNAGNDDRFATFDAVVDYFKDIYSAWGEVPQKEWINVAENSSRKLEDGTYALAYDPAIAAPIKGNLDAVPDVDVWPIFEAIQVPILLLHGAESSILTNDVAQEMKRRNKNVELVDFPGVGHCPPLMLDAQVKVVRDWLLQ